MVRDQKRSGGRAADEETRVKRIESPLKNVMGRRASLDFSPGAGGFFRPSDTVRSSGIEGCPPQSSIALVATPERFATFS